MKRLRKFNSFIDEGAKENPSVEQMYPRSLVESLLHSAFVIGAGNPQMKNSDVQKWIDRQLDQK